MQAEVHVELVIENQHVNGIGIDHDILQASCKAYVKLMLNILPKI